MSYDNYYQYNGEVDLDAQTLFDYVNQQDEVSKMINNVVPEKPDIFGKAAEPFESTCKNNLKNEQTVQQAKKEPQLELAESADSVEPANSSVDEPTSSNINRKNHVSYFKWFIFILLGLLALYFFLGTQSVCGSSRNGTSYTNTPRFVNDNMVDTMTPTVGSEFRAIFAR
jgi:hypothetical protein